MEVIPQGGQGGLRALTLVQPMASAIVVADARFKRTENRSRPLPRYMQGHATVVAVHAGLGWDDAYAELVRRILGDAIHWDRIAEHHGCIVGLMRLTGRQFTTDNPPVDDPWWSGPFGYEIEVAAALPDPILCREGFHRGWWRVPDGIASRVFASIAMDLRP
jgi:hypothetical protein